MVVIDFLIFFKGVKTSRPSSPYKKGRQDHYSSNTNRVKVWKEQDDLYHRSGEERLYIKDERKISNPRIHKEKKMCISFMSELPCP